jgi:multisubunit Na+/H+ antiporter MnhF subunit
MPIPRGLLLAAMLYAIAAFAAIVGLKPPIQPTSSAYTPMVRSLLAALAFGIALLWPTARMADRGSAWPARRVALDAVTLAIALQAIFWPLHLVTQWTLARAAAVDLMLVGWIAASGAAIACAMRPGGRPSAWSLAWIAFAAGGPLLDVLGVPPPWPGALGPFVALIELAPVPEQSSQPVEWARAAWPWTVAAAGWALALRGLGRPATGVAPAHPLG